MRTGKTEKKNPLATQILHLFALSAFALTQPLLAVLKQNPDFLVARKSTPLEIVFFLLFTALAPPATLGLLESVFSFINKKLGRALHIVFVTIFAIIIALPILKGIKELPSASVEYAALATGVIISMTYLKFEGLRSAISLLFPVVFIFPIIFAMNDQVRKIIIPSKSVETMNVKVKGNTPIIMVIFDEIALTYLMNKNREIDNTRYPNLAKLANESYWFRNTTAVADGTVHAVPAILSGLYYTGHPWKLPAITDYPNNLFTLLNNYYELNVIETATQLCPEGENKKRNFTASVLSLLADSSVVLGHIVLPARYAKELPDITQGWGNFIQAGGVSNKKGKNFFGGNWLKHVSNAIAADRAKLFDDFVVSIEDTDKPTLNFLHILFPHPPLMYLPSGKTYGNQKIEGLLDDRWNDDEWAVTIAFQRYLLQLQYGDKLIGELVTRLKEIGSYDESLIVIVADHGLCFAPSQFRRPVTETNYMDILPVPFFVKTPHQTEGVISDKNVETIDILPTIADILDINIPWKIDGWSALDDSRPERENKRIFSYKWINDKLSTPEIESKIKEFTFGPKIDEKYETLERMTRLFGPGGSKGLYVFGRYGTLVGRKLAEFETNKSDVRTTTMLENGSNYITGHLYSTGKTHLALSINDTIQGTTETFTSGDFALLLETSISEDKMDDVKIFIISEDDSGKIKLSETLNG